MIVYVSIGNSDDRLTQREWAEFVIKTDQWVKRYSESVHGNWRSRPDDPWQNACWCVELDPDSLGQRAVGLFQLKLRELAAEFRQDSIAWAETIGTEFLGADR